MKVCLVAVESLKIPEAPVVHFVRATDKAAYISTYKVRPTWAWRAQRGPRPGRRRSFQSHCLLHRHRTVTFPQDGSSELCRPVDRQEGNIGSVEGLFYGCLPPTQNSHLFFISSSFFCRLCKTAREVMGEQSSQPATSVTLFYSRCILFSSLWARTTWCHLYTGPHPSQINPNLAIKREAVQGGRRQVIDILRCMTFVYVLTLSKGLSPRMTADPVCIRRLILGGGRA